MDRPAFILSVALAGFAAAAAAQPRERDYDEPREYRDRDEVREAYRRGFERGFDRGYEKGLRETERRAPPAAVVAPPPPAPPVATGPIKIIRASYGTSSKNCDATRYVRHQADGRGSHSLKVSNDMCGDPAHGDRKSLEVSYWCGQVAKEASAREHNTIYMSCP